MGAWGDGIFENDQTLDAVADLRESSDPEAHLERRFRDFLAATPEGYDRTKFAEEWAPACIALGLCQVLRLACSRRRKFHRRSGSAQTL